MLAREVKAEHFRLKPSVIILANCGGKVFLALQLTLFTSCWSLAFQMTKVFVGKTSGQFQTAR